MHEQGRQKEKLVTEAIMAGLCVGVKLVNLFPISQK